MATQLNLDFEKYCQIERVNASLLVHAFDSWNQFRYLQRHGYRPKVDTRVGTALHHMVELLPVEKFLDTYSIMPDFAKSPDNLTKDGKQSTSRTGWVKAQEEQFAIDHQDRILPRKQFERAKMMLGALQANPDAMELIENSNKELTVTGDLNSVDCKGRLDGLRYSHLWDVKSTKSIHPIRFGSIAARLRYVFNMAFYVRILQANDIEVDNVSIIAVLDTEWHDGGAWRDAPESVVYDIPMVVVENQYPVIDKLLLEYQECVALGKWPSTPRQDLFVPNWSMEDDNAELTD